MRVSKSHSVLLDNNDFIKLGILGHTRGSSIVPVTSHVITLIVWTTEGILGHRASAQPLECLGTEVSHMDGQSRLYGKGQRNASDTKAQVSIAVGSTTYSPTLLARGTSGGSTTTAAEQLEALHLGPPDSAPCILSLS